MTISRVRRARLLAAVAGPALVLAACGDAGGGGGGGDVEASRPADFEATPTYLAQVVESSTAQPYRFDGSFSMGGYANGDFGGFADVPVLTGSFDGARVHQRLDMEPMLEAMAEESGEDMRIDLDEVDLSMDTVADGRTVYLRAPDYDQLVANARPGRTPPPLIEALSEQGDAWGRVDLDALGDDLLPRDVTNALSTGQSADPAALLDMVANASGADELDSEEVDGEPMVGVAADVRLADMYEAQGTDFDDVIAQMESQPGAPPNLREIVQDFVVSMEVRIDADGHVRRLVQDMGQALTELARELGGPSAEGAMLNMVVTMDFQDYGDESIEVPVPDPAEAVDMTGTFQEMQAELVD